MGTKWFTGGVIAAPRGRIQFDFIFNGIRYRPTIKRPPSEANLRRARERLEAIKQQISLGTFSFEEEFPDYRLLRRLTGVSSAACVTMSSMPTSSTVRHDCVETKWQPPRYDRIERYSTAFGAHTSGTEFFPKSDARAW